MIGYEQFIKGVADYLDVEMMSKINDMNTKILLGAMIIGSNKKMRAVYDALKENPLIKAFGVIDENDNIDIDLLHDSLTQSMKNDCLSFQLPIVGNIKLNKDDIDKLYGYMTYGRPNTNNY